MYFYTFVEDDLGYTLASAETQLVVIREQQIDENEK